MKLIRTDLIDSLQITSFTDTSEKDKQIRCREKIFPEGTGERIDHRFTSPFHLHRERRSNFVIAMGCGQSQGVLVSIVEPPAPEVPVLPARISINTSNRLTEDCIVLWFLPDASLNIESERAKLREILSTVKTFADAEEYVAYVSNIRVEKAFLIVPPSPSFLPSIEGLPQVEKIYTLDGSLPSDIDRLCEELKVDVDLCELDLLVVTPTAQSKKQEASFLCVQLMREILFRMKFDVNSKSEFVQFCRLHYPDEPEVETFDRTYGPQRALDWLLRRGFIWRLIQRMQRTQEIDILYKLGFFLKHAHQQLNVFQENNAPVTANTLTVYRGKTMSGETFDEFLRENEGGLVSFDSFFTAQMQREVAVEFLRQRHRALPKATAILFEIHVDPSLRSARSPFASLDKINGEENVENNGILFGMYTVFRIQSIESPPEEEEALAIWTVKLVLIDDEDNQLLRLVAPLRSSEVHSNPLSYMGKLFLDKGDYEHAEQFFLAMLEDPIVQSQPLRLARVHKGLGTNFINKKEYGKALEHYQLALAVSLQCLPADHTDLVSLYDAIGKAFYEQGDYLRAVENYEHAADLLGHHSHSIDEHFASDLASRMNNCKKFIENKP